MPQSKDIFRHELKYAISAAQLPLLKSRIMHLMQPDPHAGSDGIYNIRSLYFDDYYNRCYYENENGSDPREKFRIRIYNHSTKRIVLECKRKERGMTQKASCPLTLEQANLLIQGKPIPFSQSLPPLLNKLLLEMKLHGLRPVIIVEYERIPFIYKHGNVRVTFDTQICSSPNVTEFFSDVIPKRQVMPVGHHLMEVKFDEYLPDFIYRSLNLNQLQRISFSKFYLCRKFSIHK